MGDSLPETRSSRVPEPLPCALSRAHGKEHVCRVPRRRHMAKQWTHGSAGCLSCAIIYNTRQKKTHGKMSSLPCATKDTRQNVLFAMCLFLSHGKFVKKKFILPLKLFCLSLYCMWDSILGFGIFLGHFDIFNIVI